MQRVLRELFADLLQLGHPGNTQVTVLQTHPGALIGGVLDGVLRNGTLALTERNRQQLAAKAHVLSELGELVHRGSTGGQHKDERGGAFTVTKALLHVELRWLDKLHAHGFRDEVLHRGHNHVRTHTAQNAELLEGIVLVAHHLIHQHSRGVGLHHRLPLLAVYFVLIFEALEGRHMIQRKDIIPSTITQPRERIRFGEVH
mmetsp:Transcript_8711/g.14805  ORF Transcript_8711/g.14805 Transcript_8711/m.14805 type:complete len:201 (-) Transcript_8711:899-1501(-)